MKLTQKHPSTLIQLSRENIILIIIDIIIIIDICFTAILPTFSFYEADDHEQHLKREVKEPG